MKIHLISDLHNEFRRMPANYAPPECDVVVLAGDIGTGTSGMQWAIDTFKVPTFYVAGNHEFYGYSLDLYGELDKLANTSDHVRFMQNGTDMHIEDKAVVFIGATLWTDYDLDGTPVESSRYAYNSMNDFVRISDATIGRILEENLRSKQYILDELKRHDDWTKVVVTHHAPSPGSIQSKYLTSKLNPAFSSHFLDTIPEEIRPDLWLHGHMHDACEYSEGKTRVVCNPRGYPGKQSGFDIGKVIEI